MDPVEEILSETFKIKPDRITKETGPEDVEEWDSLGQLSLVLAIEQRFRITLETKEIFEIFNVGDIYRILRGRGVL